MSEPERGENPNHGEHSTSGKSSRRTYRKKLANTVRLCADDTMTRDNLERFQDTYAEAMAKYGFQRGVRGSDARHIATTQYYRDLHVKNEGVTDASQYALYRMLTIMICRPSEQQMFQADGGVPNFARTFEAMMTRFETFAERVDALCRSNGEKTMQEWLDNQEVCQLLGISLRTLQTLRDNGTIPHARVGSKMYYKPDDMKRMVAIVADQEKKKTYKQIGG